MRKFHSYMAHAFPPNTLMILTVLTLKTVIRTRNQPSAALLVQNLLLDSLTAQSIKMTFSEVVVLEATKCSGFDLDQRLF